MGSGKQSEMLTLGNGVPQFIYGVRFCDAGRVIAAGGSGTNSTHIIKRGSQEVPNIYNPFSFQTVKIYIVCVGVGCGVWGWPASTGTEYQQVGPSDRIWWFRSKSTY